MLIPCLSVDFFDPQTTNSLKYSAHTNSRRLAFAISWNISHLIICKIRNLVLITNHDIYTVPLFLLVANSVSNFHPTLARLDTLKPLQEFPNLLFMEKHFGIEWIITLCEAAHRSSSCPHGNLNHFLHKK